MTRITQRAAKGSGPRLRPSASITAEDWAASAVAAASPPENQADRAGAALRRVREAPALWPGSQAGTPRRPRSSPSPRP